MQKSFYRRSVLFLVCLVTLMHTGVVQAGEINAEEARLVGAASGTFTYEGKQYRASSQYVSELRSYLSRDDVDLEAGDVVSLISDMYANVEVGLRNGYLEEIGDAPEAQDETSEDAGKDASEEKPGETDAKENAEPDEAYPKEQNTDKTEKTEADPKEQNTDKTEKTEADPKEQNTDKTEKTEADPKVQNIDKTEKSGAEDKSVWEQPVYTAEATQDGTNLVDAEGEIIFTAKSMIKNTGYHTQSAYGICILGILALTPICGGIYLVSRHEKE